MPLPRKMAKEVIVWWPKEHKAAMACSLARRKASCLQKAGLHRLIKEMKFCSRFIVILLLFFIEEKEYAMDLLF
jgi:hypothetical protein